MESLIGEYRTSVVEAGCAPGSGRYGLKIDLDNDISAALPYVNATVNEAFYDHENHILVWREADQAYALRPLEIKVARIEDPVSARDIASEIVCRVNKVWSGRHNITPRFTERKLPTVIDLFRLLPKTNCRQCGYATCLAYAADLRVSRARLESCLPLCKTEYAASREKLLHIMSSVG